MYCCSETAQESLVFYNVHHPPLGLQTSDAARVAEKLGFSPSNIDSVSSCKLICINLLV